MGVQFHQRRGGEKHGRSFLSKSGSMGLFWVAFWNVCSIMLLLTLDIPKYQLDVWNNSCITVEVCRDLPIVDAIFFCGPSKNRRLRRSFWDGTEVVIPLTLINLLNQFMFNFMV